MSTEVGAAPWGGVELLERAIGYTRGALALVVPELLTAPTPCRDWDLRRLLEHMDDSLTSLHEAGTGHRVSLTPLGRPTPHPAGSADLVDRLRARACQLLGEWTAEWTSGAQPRRDVVVEGRPLTSAVLTSAGALEIAVHGWDVAEACGVRRPLPDRLAIDLMRIAPVVVTPGDRPGRFDEPVLVLPDATPGERLLAFLGRE